MEATLLFAPTYKDLHDIGLSNVIYPGSQLVDLGSSGRVPFLTFQYALIGKLVSSPPMVIRSLSPP